MKENIPLVAFLPEDIDWGLLSVSSSLDEKTSLRRGVRLERETKKTNSSIMFNELENRSILPNGFLSSLSDACTHSFIQRCLFK